MIPTHRRLPGGAACPERSARTQWSFRRCVAHLPAAGGILLFDRSCCNRAGVERVMGFRTEAEVEEFFRSVPEFERMLVRSGIRLVKSWFPITDAEQALRFRMRIADPLRQWKLSPMDVESRRRWEDYTRAKGDMLARTHIPEAPWWVVEADNERRAWLIRYPVDEFGLSCVLARRSRGKPGRALSGPVAPWIASRPLAMTEGGPNPKRSSGNGINGISHLLEQIPYGPVEHPPVVLPDRVRRADDSGRRSRRR